jgi:hypothetical protein
MGREVWRDIEAVGDIGSLDDILKANFHLIEQLKQALPSWWTGGSSREGESFEGLEHVIERVRRDCVAADQPNYGG